MLGALLLAGCGDDGGGMSPDGGPSGPTCDDAVELFPTPVSDSNSLFPTVDDSEMEVSFGMGFGFPFYGQDRTSVFLNTNGGMTFASTTVGTDYDLAATDIDVPAIAVFWGDLDAAAYGGESRADQMSYQQCDDRFIVTYAMIQDNDEETWNNTATVTLFDDGTIEVDYGTVLSEDILVGVMDGTHTGDTRPALPLQSEYDMSDSGSGVLLFDDWGSGPSHTGQLSNQTLRYVP